MRGEARQGDGMGIGQWEEVEEGGGRWSSDGGSARASVLNHYTILPLETYVLWPLKRARPDAPISAVTALQWLTVTRHFECRFKCACAQAPTTTLFGAGLNQSQQDGAESGRQAERKHARGLVSPQPIVCHLQHL
jgi:hypothetical protein